MDYNLDEDDLINEYMQYQAEPMHSEERVDDDDDDDYLEEMMLEHQHVSQLSTSVTAASALVVEDDDSSIGSADNDADMEVIPVDAQRVSSSRSSTTDLYAFERYVAVYCTWYMMAC
jgi:hypothetical protein